MKTLQWVLFGAMVVAQLAVPFSMIATREETLTAGTAYKFRCGPVDPYDYFRGRYVALSFRDTTIDHWQGERFPYGSTAFAHLGVDADGFAQILDVTTHPPEVGDYLEVEAHLPSHAGASLRVQLPFDKYFMNEYDAPAAEAAYRDQSRTETGAHVVVHVREGEGVIEGLYIDDVPIEEYLRRTAETPPDAVAVP